MFKWSVLSLTIKNIITLFLIIFFGNSAGLLNAQVSFTFRDTSEFTKALNVANEKKDGGENELALVIYSQIIKGAEACDCDKYMFSALEGQAEIYIKTMNNKALIICLTELELLAKKNRLKLKLGSIFAHLALAYEMLGDEEKSMHYFHESMSLCSKRDTSCIAKNLRGIARAYSMKKEYKKAISIIRQVHELYFNTKDTLGLVKVSNLLGIIYNNLNKSDSAKLIYKEALDLANFIVNDLLIAQLLNNIGEVYLNQSKYEVANKYYLAALDKAESSQHLYGISLCKMNLALIKIQTHKYKEADNLLNESLEINIANGYVGLQKAVYEKLCTLYEMQGLFKESLAFHRLFIEARDSFINEKSIEENIRMEMKYELSKKRRLYEEQAEEVRLRSARFRDVMTILLTLLIVISLVIVWFYKQQSSKNNTLEAQALVIEKQQKKIMDSLSYAKKVQHASLVSETKFKSIFPESFIFFRPKDVVSGDLYWAAEIDNVKLLAVIDCTGHGVPGAFMSMIVTTLLNSIVFDKHEFSPSIILSKMNNAIYDIFVKHNDGEAFTDGIDMSLCVFDLQNSKLHYSGAVHDIYMIRSGQMQLIKGSSSSIGGISFRNKRKVEKAFEEHSIDINKGDQFYLFTDGYIDQFGGPNFRKLNVSRFKKIISEFSDYSYEQQIIYLDTKFDNWKGDNPQTDDALVVGIRV